MSSSLGRAGLPVPPLAGAALLERAISYTRVSLQLVGSVGSDGDQGGASAWAGARTSAPAGPLNRSTPCADWDLLTLLRHMDDSLAAFTDAAEIGYVDLAPVRTRESAADAALVIVDRLKRRACAALAAWAHDPGVGGIPVADRLLRSDLLAAAGSLEIAVHGWDVAQACGVDRPIPAALALELLDVVPILVSDADRPRRFAERVDVPVHARPSARLLAAVGRRTQV